MSDIPATGAFTPWPECPASIPPDMRATKYFSIQDNREFFALNIGGANHEMSIQMAVPPDVRPAFVRAVALGLLDGHGLEAEPLAVE